jgi:hypothetical protein
MIRDHNPMYRKHWSRVVRLKVSVATYGPELGAQHSGWAAEEPRQSEFHEARSLRTRVERSHDYRI